LAEHRVTTRTELASGLPLISGHKRQLQQVISNLVQNAIEAMDYTTDRDRVLRVRTCRMIVERAVNSLWPQTGTMERGSNLFCRPSFPMQRSQTDRLDFRLEHVVSRPPL